MPQPHLTRRGLALAALATTGAVAGCTPVPTVRPRGGTAPGASRTPDAALERARAGEAELVAALDAALAAPKAPRSPAQAAALRQLRDAHAAHVETLDRLGGIPSIGTPSPPADASAWAPLSKKIGALEARVGQTHRAAAGSATDPSQALLLASLATFTALNTSPGRPVVDDTTSPAAAEVGTRTDALLVLLSRLRALAEGLEVGLGQIPSTDKLIEPMRKHLVQVWAARDRVEDQLRAAGQGIPPAELGYVMPGGFGSVAQARTTWALLEDDVTAAWARVAAASSGADRNRALDAMLAQARTALGLGAPLTRWPGWV